MNQSDIYHYEMEQSKEYQEYLEYAYQARLTALEQEQFETTKDNE